MELGPAGVVQQVAFIHDDDVCEFHLVAEELRDRALVLRLSLPTTVLEGAAGHELVHEGRAVDDRH